MQHNTYRNSVFDNLWPLLHCVHESTCQDSKHIFDNRPASGEPVVGYSLFRCEMSSAVGFHKPGIKAKTLSTCPGGFLPIPGGKHPDLKVGH